MIPIDGDFIMSIAPRFSGRRAESQWRIVAEVSAMFASTLDAYAINTKLRIRYQSS